MHELIKRNNLILIALYFITFILIYGSSLVKNGYHVDEIADFTNNMQLQYIATQRWGVSIFRYIAGASSTPWASGVFCGVCISIALFLQTRILNISNDWLQLIYGLTYYAIPQTCTFLIFSIQIDAIASAILLISAIIYCITKTTCNKWVKGCTALIILAYAIACYQTTVIYYTTLCTGWLLSEFLSKKDNKSVYRTYIWSVSIIVPALILYFAISKLALLSFNIPVEYLECIKNYRKDTIVIQSIPNNSPITVLFYIIHCFKLTLISFLDLTRWQFMYTACIIPTALLVINICYTPSVHLKKLLYSIIAVIIYIIAHAQSLLFMKASISHTGMLTVPLSCAILCTLAIHHSPVLKERKTRIYTFALLLLSCINTMYLNNRLTNSMKLKYEAENARMNNLLQDAYRVAAQFGINMNNNRIILFKNYPVYFDYLKHTPQWNMFYVADIKEFCEYHKELAEMNPWPHVNSVKAINGRIIIKLMDTHYQIPESPRSQSAMSQPPITR